MHKIIIGLGNPGKEYEWTRHNLGFIVLDALKAQSAPEAQWEKHHKADVQIAKAGETILLKPLTYMNNSGSAIKQFLQYHKLTPADILVIHDDIDMDFLKIRQTDYSSSGGHNGVQSIIDALGTQQFARLKIGVKNKKRSLIAADRFVLMPFSFLEKMALKRYLPELFD